MEENRIITFLTVAKEGSFTKAADILYLSPVAVKKQIDALEEELGGALFLRTPAGCKLTEAGDVFQTHAEKILKMMEKARLEVESSLISAAKEITIGYDIRFNYRYLGTLSAGFADVAEDHIIQFTHAESADMISQLLSRRFHCFLSRRVELDERYASEITFIPLCDLPVYAIFKKGHELSKKSRIVPEDLTPYEVFATEMLKEESLNRLKNSAGSFKILEDADRNTLFNRVLKGAVELFPNTFEYYDCIPMEIDPIQIGIYSLKKQPQIIWTMLDYMKEVTENYTKESNIL